MFLQNIKNKNYYCSIYLSNTKLYFLHFILVFVFKLYLNIEMNEYIDYESIILGHNLYDVEQSILFILFTSRFCVLFLFVADNSLCFIVFIFFILRLSFTLFFLPLISDFFLFGRLGFIYFTLFVL